jgi:outer membrane protein OmpA-like peptidoglycan-associated protein
MVLMAGLAIHANAAGTSNTDLPGSHDHPVVSRFAGSTIVGYQQVAYDQASLPLGPYVSSKHGFGRSETLAGRVTRIAYVVPPGKSTLEVYRNFAQALQAAGFATRFACAGETCGDGAAFSDRLIAPLLDKLGHGARNAMVQTLYAIDGDTRALTAHLERPAGAVDVSVLVSTSDSSRERQPVGVLLQVVEAESMDQGQVAVDARAMGKGLAQAGHIALYGIRFASDSAVLDKASDATLAQMAALLEAQPALKAYVVGHTDDSGSLAHNLTLSQQRAEAVVKALTTRYGIAPARLAAKGLASYAPVASNHDDAGKAKNRRVELVEQ